MNEYMNPPLFTILTLSTHCTSQYSLNSSFGFPPWWRGSLSLWPAGKGKLHGWCSETACHQWNYSEAQALWLPCVRWFLGLAAFQKMKSEKTSLLYHFSSIHEKLGCAKIEQSREEVQKALNAWKLGLSRRTNRPRLNKSRRKKVDVQFQ